VIIVSIKMKGLEALPVKYDIPEYDREDRKI
jgi:hypothetical protein